MANPQDWSGMIAGQQWIINLEPARAKCKELFESTVLNEGDFSIFSEVNSGIIIGLKVTKEVGNKGAFKIELPTELLDNTVAIQTLATYLESQGIQVNQARTQVSFTLTDDAQIAAMNAYVTARQTLVSSLPSK